MPASKTAIQQLHQSLLPSEPVTVASVSVFVRVVARVWKHDPEVAHDAEFEFRTRVLQAIGDGKLKCSDAREACALLARLGRNTRLQRWFA